MGRLLKQGVGAPKNNGRSFTERSLEPNSSSAIMSKKEQVLVIEPPIGLSFKSYLSASALLVVDTHFYVFVRAHLHGPLY